MQSEILSDLFIPLLIITTPILFAIRDKYALVFTTVLLLISCALAIGYLIYEILNGNGSPGTYILIGLFILGGAHLYYKRIGKKQP